MGSSPDLPRNGRGCARQFERRDFLDRIGRGALALWVAESGLLALGCDDAGSTSSGQSATLQADGSAPRASTVLAPSLSTQRVHAHTHVGPRYWTHPVFGEVEDRLARLGARVITRYVRMGAEPAWWVDGGGRPGREAMRAMVERAHARGQRIIGYYWHTADDAAAAEHPEWVCRDASGAVLRSNRGAYLDLTTPWRERVLADLMTMGELGFDGVYFDARHFPDDGCQGSAVAASYERETGRAAPRSANERDADYGAFLDYQAAVAAETFAWWKSNAAARYPDLAFIVSTSVLAALGNRRVTTDLVRVADSAKTELRLAVNGRANLGVFNRPRRPASPPPSLRAALSWALLRDAAPGRAPHVWLNNLPDARAFEDTGAAVLAWGGIANFNVETAALLDEPGATPQMEGLATAFALDRWASPILAEAQPLDWGGVLFSERERNAFGGEHVRMWREQLWPLTGAFGAFVAEGLPVRIVDDRQLADGGIDSLRVLFVPDRAALAPDQMAILEAFEARGGVVIPNQSDWQWHVEGMGAAAPLRARLRELGSDVPIAGAALDGCHLIAYNRAGRGGLAAIAPPFGWVLDEETPPSRGQAVFVSSQWSSATDLRTGDPIPGERSARGWSFSVPVDGLKLIGLS